MGKLGKDLFYMRQDFFEITALFADGSLEITERTYRMGEVTTAFLNYDPEEYIEAVEPLRLASGGERESLLDGGLRERLNSLICAMPFYEDYADWEKQLLSRVQPEAYVTLADDLALIQEQYAWFLTRMFYRKMDDSGPGKYFTQIEENGLSAYVSGKSLGLNADVDPVPAGVQFKLCISAATGKPQLFEKMMFKGLLDFIYADLFKAIMHGNVPKRCGNCDRWFLQEKGFSYEYCSGPAPEGNGKTCREVGAAASFRDKVKNNPVWEIHQRAYKKYYARVLKGKMTKAAFNEWALKAEQLRNETLEQYENTLRWGREYPLESYKAELDALAQD